MLLGVGARYPRIISGLRALADRASARSALLGLALFVLVGTAVLDDYGTVHDEVRQRSNALSNWDYALGRPYVLERYQERAYGVVFEMPLLWAEQLLGLRDSRAIYLCRHLLKHLFFLAGGLGGAALAFRLYGSRRLALCALGLFLLHPRLYANSFYNAKDIPFLSLFLLALLLLHRTCRRGHGAAFLLCGAGVGALTSARVMGLLLFGAVLALRACDGVLAADRAARGRVLRSGGLFAAAFALTLYATFPWLWSDPVGRFAETLRYMTQHPHAVPVLFRGVYVSSQAVPPSYVPVWAGITTPPYAWLLAGVGAAALLRRSWRRPGALVRNTRLRFEGLLLACCVLPVLIVILLGSTMYGGWRHTYFLYAPLGLLAAGGLHALGTAACRLWRGGRGWVYGLAGAGAGATLVAMAMLHPNQHLYFNFLVDRATPERLGAQYGLDMGEASSRQALEFLTTHYPRGPIYVDVLRAAWKTPILPAADRQRLSFVGLERADFHVSALSHTRARPGAAARPYAPRYGPAVHTLKVYGSTVFAVTAVNPAKVDAVTAAPYRAAYRALAASEPVVRAHFDVYLDERALTLVKASCAAADVQARFILHVTPADRQDLSPARRLFGFDNLDFSFVERGVRVDGACLVVIPRPAYPLRHLTIGQQVSQEEGMLWQADVSLLTAEPAYRAAYRTLVPRRVAHAGDAAANARAAFDVYVTASTVTLAKMRCAADDAQPKFIVHAVPVDPRTLPNRPFNNLDFSFVERGVRVDGACLAAVPLPAWPIRHLTVGQWRPGDAQALWQVDIPFPLAPRAVNAHRAAYRALTTGTPAHRGAFDVYVTPDAIAFAKAPCAAADTAPRFFLHVIPVRPRDLPPARQGAGFGNQDFEFAWQGAHFDGACLVRVPLPAYPIDRLRVGQFRPGEDPLWRAEIARAR